jgi:tRNA U38,U39,U40 pseudouridine synthase TruA
MKKMRWGDAMRPEQYGLDQQWIREVKERFKDQRVTDQVKRLIDGVTKEDLQSRSFLTRKIRRIVPVLGMTITQKQAEGIIQFIIDQKLDPNNTWHLIKLWNMLRGY